MNTSEWRILDISMPISFDMPVYKGKEAKRPLLKTEIDFSIGSVYESKLEMNLHTGTHLDRTLHMMPEGNTVDSLNITEMITQCRLLDLSYTDGKITEVDLSDKEIKEGEFILLKTKNSFEAILEKEFIYLDQSGAKYLADKKVKGVGIDSLGIERNQPGHETHLQLMKAGVHILEGLRLKDIEEGNYLLFAVPLNIVGAEASPVRAVLIQDKYIK